MQKKHTLKNRLLSTLTFLLLISISWDVQAEKAIRLKWGALPARVGSFTYVATLCRTVNDDLSGRISITPVQTGGFIENIFRLKKKTVHCALTHNLAAYASYKSIADFKGKGSDRIRGLWGGYRAPILQVAIKGRGIKSIYDLNGKPYVFSPSSSSGRITKMFLESLGVQPDYKMMGIASGIDAMKAGSVDAFYRIGPLDSSILEVQSTMEIEFLPVAEEDLEKFEKAWPKHAIEYTLPANTYKGQTEPVLCLGYTCGDYSHASVNEDVIYQIVMSAYRNRDNIAASVPLTVDGNWADMWNQTLEYMKTPLHKGAVKAYRELGYTIPDELIPPEAR